MTHPALTSPVRPANEKQKDPLLLNKADAASALGITEKTLNSWVKEHDLPRIQIGRSVRFSINGLQSCIEGKKV